MFSKQRQRQVLYRNLKSIKSHAASIPEQGWVRKFRYLFDISQRDLARLAGLSQKRIDAIETGEVDARIELATLQKMAEVFESDLYYVFIPRKPMEEIRASLINRTFQNKYGCDEKAKFAANKKIYRLNLRGLYGEDAPL